MQPELRVPVAYRAPFDFNGKCWVEHRAPGESILEMVRACPVLPASFERSGYVCINGEVVPRHMWALVTPKPSRPDRPIAVTMHLALQAPGGGGGGAKQTYALVAAIALLVVATVITGGGASGLIFPGIGEVGLFEAGSLSAQLLAGAVTVGGALAISALTAPPTAAAGIDAGGVNSEQAEAASASGNILDRGGSVPRVLGTRKIFPPFACEPVVELVDQDEVVEGLYVLNGPHALNDIRIDGAPIDEAEDVEFDTREGWPSDSQQTLIERQGRTLAPQLELSDLSLQSDGNLLQHQSLPETDLSVFHSVSTRHSPDEVWMHLLFPGGLYPGSNAFAAVPFRVRFRKRGDVAWVNCPELHYQFNSVNQRRLAFLFKWTASADPPVQPPASTGFYYAHLHPPLQTTAPVTPPERQWDADAYFDDGSGANTNYNGGGATRVTKCNMYDNRVEIFLDPASYPQDGIYEFQIRRGVAYAVANFTKNVYTYGGLTLDFFWYQGSVGSYAAAQNHSNYSDRCVFTRMISIWNEVPITTPGQFALIAVKAINRSIRQLSVQASGYVKDWDGSDWTTWTTTSNPAPHYVDVLSGDLNLDPLPDDLRDDDGIVAWRTLCTSNDWTCDLIVNDTRTQDILNSIASCAYARPYQSDQYSVIVDNDRTLDVPVQVFSRRNSGNLRFEKAFARLPAGFNVTYRDESLDDDQAQITVYPTDMTSTDLTLLENISYDGVIDEDKVETRARFDLDQASQRSTFYYMDADIESIVCRRGSLVAVEHDILTARAGDGYIVSKQLGAGSPIQITGVTLDSEIPITNELDMHAVTDMHAVADMHDVGITTGIAIRHTDGTISTHALSNVTGSTAVLTFTTPFTDDATIQGFTDNDRKYGCLVVAGALGLEYRRLLVQAITPGKDFTAQMVLVDEAPSLVRFSAGSP